MSAPLTDAELLDLHARLVSIPSVSGSEEEIVAFAAGFLADRGIRVETIERNVVAVHEHGAGPTLLLNTHLDTVPAAAGYTRDPWKVENLDGRIHGLGSNDAKAAAAGMIAAICGCHEAGTPGRVVLTLVADEETGGRGTELVWPTLEERGLRPDGVVVGEPTSLDIAVAQKGMLILELHAEGDACHSANGRALGARNAVFGLARDLVRIEDVALSAEHPKLGMTTLEATLTSGGRAKNAVPDHASSILDIRTVPGRTHEDVIAELEGRVEGRVEVRSKRLRPTECAETAAVVRAALAARPDARLYGSSTMSDLVYFEGVPAVKVGPGATARSHTADEWIGEDEVLAGARFYSDVVAAFAASETGEAQA